MTPTLSLPRSWVEVFTDDRVVIRRPLSNRFVGMFVGGLFGACACGGVVLAVSLFRENAEMAAFLLITALLIGAGSILVVPFAGPLVLDCDVRQGTYRFHYLAPASTTIDGALSDFTGIAVDSVTNSKGAGTTYRVLLRWKNPPRVFGRPSRTVIAYETFDQPEANAVAQALSAKLGLPLTP